MYRIWKKIIMFGICNAFKISNTNPNSPGDGDRARWVHCAEMNFLHSFNINTYVYRMTYWYLGQWHSRLIKSFCSWIEECTWLINDQGFIQYWLLTTILWHLYIVYFCESLGKQKYIKILNKFSQPWSFLSIQSS